MNPMGGMSGQVMDGYFWSMLFLASMPYLLLFVIGGGIFRALRKERQQEVARALEEQAEWEAGQ